MPRSIATLLLVYSMLIVTTVAPVHAQPQARPVDNTIAEVPKKPEPANTTTDAKPAKKKIDFKKVIEEETKRLKVDSAKFDPVKIELEKAKQARKSGWSKKDTALMVVFAVGIAVLVWFVIKYGKECAETNPPHCSLGTDEFCTCERYEEENSNRAIPR